jgi:hypothetical protein
MVLEELTIIGLAGVDAFLASTYLNSRKRAPPSKAVSPSYSGAGASVASSFSPAACPVPSQAGDSTVLTDRLAAIKSAVGQTKFADEVLPYDLGKTPALSDEFEAKPSGPSSIFEPEFGEETFLQPESAQPTFGQADRQFSFASGLEEKVNSIYDSVKSSESKMNDLASGFSVLEYRIAAVEQMLGVAKGKQKPSEEIDIPLKPVMIQPYVIGGETKAAASNRARQAKKSPAKASKPIAKNAGKTIAKGKTRQAKNDGAKKRIEPVVKNVPSLRTKKTPRKSAKSRKVELVLRSPASKRATLHKVPSSPDKVELILKDSRQVAQKRKPASKVLASKAGAVLKPQKKAKAIAGPKKVAAAKATSEEDSKDHMDIEWNGSKIKLYSGESKD